MYYHPLVTLLHNGNGGFKDMVQKKKKKSIFIIIIKNDYFI